MNSSNSHSLLLLLLILLTSVPLPASATPTRPSPIPNPLNQSSLRVSAMYVLGDSSVDCGDNTLFYSLLHRNRSLFPCNGSDSSLVPYLLAKRMGVEEMRTFYSLDGSINEMLKGVNFGAAQATIMNSGRSTLQSLSGQLRQVMDTFQLMQLHLGEDAAKDLIKSFMFYVSFGKDDYTDIYLSNSSGIMSKGGLEFTHMLVSEMIQGLRELYRANVSKIVVMGILPLGCSPRIMLYWRNVTSEDGCVKEVNDLVVAYNNLLENALASEFRIKYPDARVVFCDVYRVILDIVTRPTSYGFEDVKSACCGVGELGAVIGCLSLESTCNRSSSHVWWDFYNPTFAVNTLLAESAWSGKPIPNICRPLSILELVSA